MGCILKCAWACCPQIRKILWTSYRKGSFEILQIPWSQDADGAIVLLITVAKLLGRLLYTIQRVLHIRCNVTLSAVCQAICCLPRILV